MSSCLRMLKGKRKMTHRREQLIKGEGLKRVLTTNEKHKHLIGRLCCRTADLTHMPVPKDLLLSFVDLCSPNTLVEIIYESS